ncbi:MAG: hypothetical protein ACOC2C_00195 [Cyclonatronaceae bacterium]
MSSAALQAQLEGITRVLEKQGYEVFFEDPEIDRAEGLITLQDVYLKQRSPAQETYIKQVEIQTSTADVLRYMLPFSGGISALREVRLRLSEMQHRQELRGAGFDLTFLQLSLRGDLGDLAQSAASGFNMMPAEAQQLSGRMLHFKAFYDVKLELLPFNIPFPELQEVSFDAAYNPETDALEIAEATVSAFDARMYFGGRIEPFSSVRAAFPEAASAAGRDIELRAELTHHENDTLNIGSDGLGMSFDRFQLRYEGRMQPGASLWERLFSEEAEIASRLENLMLRAPATFQSIYGQPLRFLGLPADGVRINALSLGYRIKTDRAEITSLAIENPYADINFTGGLRFDETEGNAGWIWENAGFHIRPSTREAQRFVETASDFFGLQLPQTSNNDGFPTYRIAIKGSLSAPELGL